MLTAGEKRRLFEGHALFGILAPVDVDALLTHARFEHYPAGHLIFARGSPGRSMMAVLRGSIRISTASPQGREVVLAILGVIRGSSPSAGCQNSSRLSLPRPPSARLGREL